MPRYFKFLPSLLIVLVGTFTLTPSIAQTNNEEPGLREFVERMLSIHGGDTKVIVGKLPEKMPVELPIPSDSQILGSIVNSKGSVQIVLDVSQSVEQVTDFYKNKLLSEAWKQPIHPGYNRGFVTTRSEFGRYNNFCKKNANLFSSLNLTIKEKKEISSTVSLTYNPIDEKVKHHPCKKPSTDYPEHIALFPALTLPLDTEASKDNYFYGGSNQSEVILKTKLDSKTLTNHYVQQLEKANWKKIDSEQNNSHSWSTWTFKDEKGKNWHGTLSFTQIPGKPNHYFANLKALQL